MGTLRSLGTEAPHKSFLHESLTYKRTMNSFLVAGLQSDKHVKNSSGKVFKTRVRIPLPPLSDSWKDNGFLSVRLTQGV